MEEGFIRSMCILHRPFISPVIDQSGGTEFLHHLLHQYSFALDFCFPWTNSRVIQKRRLTMIITVVNPSLFQLGVVSSVELEDHRHCTRLGALRGIGGGIRWRGCSSRRTLQRRSRASRLWRGRRRWRGIHQSIWGQVGRIRTGRCHHV